MVLGELHRLAVVDQEVAGPEGEVDCQREYLHAAEGQPHGW